MTKFILFTFLLSNTLFMVAQNAQLTGQAFDFRDSTRFWGLKISIIKNEKELYSSTTNNNGEFLINNIIPGTYNIKLSFIGFQDKLIENIKIIEGLNKEILYFPNPCSPSIKRCPKGHTDNIIPIVYGEPTKKTMKRVSKEKVFLGGCIITYCNPPWHCKTHNINF